MKEKKKGFTLVELLATIVILGIVLTITGYIVITSVDKSKEKSYKVTINNIEKNASTYLIENNNRLFFLTNNEKTIEYQCITVENLIDYGYLDNNVIKSKINEKQNVNGKDYIYIERNIKTKAIDKVIYNPTDKNTCDIAVRALADIAIIVNPLPNVWSQSKNITITYRLKNLNDVNTLNKYQYSYNYSSAEKIITKDTVKPDNIGEISKTINVINEGTITADITHENEKLATAKLNVGKIDRTGPTVKMGNYTGQKKLRHIVTIPLKINDSASGVDYTSITKEDINVYVGSQEVKNIKLTQVKKNGEDFNLEITNDVSNGKIVLKITKDKIFDNVKNGNTEINIDTGVTFDNTYIITYNANGGTNAPAASTYTYATSGTTNLSKNIPSRTGYTFLGWSTNKNATTKTYNAGGGYPRNIMQDVTLYAIWKSNTYTVTFDGNGGSVSFNSKTVTYNSTYGSLPTASRTGYTTTGWYTAKSGGSKIVVSTKVTATSNHTLYAQWRVNTYKVIYNANGGTGAPSATSYSYAPSGTVNLSYLSPYRGGFVFLGWSTSSSATTPSYYAGSAFNKNQARNTTLYAVWRVVPQSWSYGYTGGVQSLRVPYTGRYRLEVWGAQGGGDEGHSGGKGGYASGYVNLTAGTTIYIVVGGKGGHHCSNCPGGYNGGGKAGQDGISGGGGGATHIGRTNNLLKDTKKENVFIVAGGGGGAGWLSSCVSLDGGSGGGTSGGSSSGGGGTQSGGGGGTYGGSFGQGGNRPYAGYDGGGGGGGWYGGGGSQCYDGGGGGGSGYTGGVASGSMKNGVQSDNGRAVITWG